MKPCMVGIGGAGGYILKEFLQNMDVGLLGGFNFGERLAYGEVKGVWLESATHDTQKQSFFGSLVQGRYPPYLICHGAVNEDSPTRSYVMDKYGFDLKALGFDRRAEYLKGVFEVLESDPNLKPICSGEFKDYENPLADYMWKVGIRNFTTRATGQSARGAMVAGGKKDLSRRHCDSILFMASLGGGTGTGFINPITGFIRSEDSTYPIFTLGILTEKGKDEKHTSEGQRYLAAVIAMYDLLTRVAGEGIDVLILMDNQILKERFGDNLSGDAHIYRALKPLLDMRNYPGEEDKSEVIGIRRVFWEVDKESPKEIEESAQEKKDSAEEEKKLMPPILVPCYHIQPDYVGDINTLVEGALGLAGSTADLGKDGRLFPCDPTCADRALVFTRGFFSTEEIREAVHRRTGLPDNKIMIYRKLGDSKNEDILILLRNPYGGAAGLHDRQGTLEWRLHEIISKSIKYIEDEEINILGFHSYTDQTKDSLRNYFYGKDGLRDELNRCLSRLENGEKPIFRRPLRIFGEGAAAPAALEVCSPGVEAVSVSKAELRRLVKLELNELINSEEGKKMIRQIAE